jgi:hypothetical protein
MQDPTSKIILTISLTTLILLSYISFVIIIIYRVKKKQIKMFNDLIEGYQLAIEIEN